MTRKRKIRISGISYERYIAKNRRAGIRDDGTTRASFNRAMNVLKQYARKRVKKRHR